MPEVLQLLSPPQGGNGSFSLMATTSVRSLQGEDMLASYEADVSQENIDTTEVKGPDIPLMPLVLRIHFVSSSSGEGIPNIRKNLYRVCSNRSVCILLSPCDVCSLPVAPL